MSIKQKIGGLSAVVGGVLVSTQTALAGNLFDLPEGAVASTTAYIGDFFSDLSPFVYLAIGIPLAFYVIRKVISLVAGRAR